MLIPSTITARRTRRYTSTWYIHPTTHKHDFEPMDGSGRYIFQPPKVRQSIRPGGPLYLRLLQPFLRYSANNVGDPFQGSNYRLNTHEIEQEVITRFPDLMTLDREEAWGYVTSGGTEGNMYGLYMGRETFPEGAVYFSQDTHYSVVKLLRLLNIRNVMIRSQDNGEMDYLDLRETVRRNPDTPPIIVANIGTTMKGAVDDLGAIRNVMDGLQVRDFYIHADAALSGMILPFVPDPQPHGFDAGIDSMSISGQ